MPYLGNTPTTQSFISGTDYFNGTGAQTAFTLTRTVASVNDIEAVVNNVVQQPNDAYNISGTTITFTSAPSAGTNNVYVRYLSTTTQAITPSQNTVSWNTLDANTQQDLGINNKNRIINGAMTFDQRNAGASVTPTTSGTYTLDRWRAEISASSKFTVQQSSTAPAGFNNSLLITSSSAYTVGAADYFAVTQPIEGYNIADFGFGTANAKTVTVSFWVRSSVTGTYSAVLVNQNDTRVYPFTYTVNSANTFEYKTVTITGDVTGTWLTTNGAGIRVNFYIGLGTNFQGAVNAWNGGTVYGASGTTNLVSTNGATWYLTGVQLEVGTQATTFTTAGGSYGAELALCQRYYEKFFPQGTAPVNGLTDGLISSGINGWVAFDTTGVRSHICKFSVVKRVAPTITTFNSGSAGVSGGNLGLFRGGWSNVTVGAIYSLDYGVAFDGTNSGLTAGNAYLFNGTFTASAEL
jgi:hypothetical protein